MGWLFIASASVFEMLGVLGLRLYSQQKTIRNGLLYIGGLGGSFIFLYASFSYLLVSVAYSVFIGIGTAGAVLMNMIFFGESTNKYRIASLIAIIIGVTGLKALS
ncbi:MAG: DMT family transporter [Bacillota bacterium]|uniref:QacE family quaternary ammonium compound efflux SMR transporter n=1 Tax=Virgibacillus salarius TaxID=447199 RepID=A0A941DXG5_9BACI|nr:MULTISPECIES: SMR family transporter [Bacillaceae]NAZ09806.1 QacE family quaternary ammonium compound efflux SMR transporter [Agaribacter marinus]MBR7797097.1 QacE family quaternary ammonium compound efflux SMR transporter [Virgibacillus salarius]MCC2251441.1 QacE family quaternary ammonium compound efflux SMR transporter [Virgibacillus sp. AGTR]MDY7044840.1 SMR family transporter [Virgibacillus sp. M23]QRZ18929.1 QacE family quaternary ammonium compound efflux SMR transporter [Virgibacillu